MRRALPAVVALIGVLAVWPEFAAYRAERRLRAFEDGLRTLAARPADAARDRALVALGDAAFPLAAAQPGDPRALVLAGSARLLARDTAGALAGYRAALRTGERAEIDLDLARAHLQERDMTAAQAALVRAGWVSPTLVHGLPKPARRSLLREVKGLVRRLKAGRLAAPPSLADVDLVSPG